MKQLDEFNIAQQSIYDYFGFKEGWTVFPIDDRRKYYWENNATEVMFYDSIEAYKNQDGNHSYTDDILHHNSYPKAVYDGVEYTLIMVNTNVDGNRFLAIYDNSKKVG